MNLNRTREALSNLGEPACADQVLKLIRLLCEDIWKESGAAVSTLAVRDGDELLSQLIWISKQLILPICSRNRQLIDSHRRGERLRELERQVAEAGGQLEELTQAEQRQRELERSLTEKRRALQDAQRALAELQPRCAALEAEVRGRLTPDLEAAQSRLEALRRQRAELTAALESAAKETESTEAALAQARRQRAETEQRCRTAGAALTQVRQEQETLDGQLAGANADLERGREKLTADRAALAQLEGKTLPELKAQLESADQALETARTQANALDGQLSQATAELQKETQRRDSLRQALTDARTGTDTCLGETMTLEERLRQDQARLDIARAELRQLQNEALPALTQALTETTAALEETQRLRSENTGRLNQLALKTAAAKAQLAELQSGCAEQEALSRSLDDQIGAAQETMQTWLDRNQSAQAQLQALEQENAAAASRNEQLTRTELPRAQAEKEAFQAEHDAAQASLTRQRETLARLRQEKVDLDEGLQKAWAETQQLEKELETLRVTERALADDLREKSQEISRRNTVCAEKKAELERQEQTLAAGNFAEYQREREGQIAGLEQKSAAAQERNGALNARLSQLKDALRSAQEANQADEAEVQAWKGKLSRECERHTAELAALHGEIDGLQKQAQAQAEQLRALQEERDKKQTELNRRRLQLEQEKKQHQDWLRRLNVEEYTGQLYQLEQQVARLRKLRQSMEEDLKYLRNAGGGDQYKSLPGAKLEQIAGELEQYRREYQEKVIEALSS